MFEIQDGRFHDTTNQLGYRLYLVPHVEDALNISGNKLQCHYHSMSTIVLTENID